MELVYDKKAPWGGRRAHKSGCFMSKSVKGFRRNVVFGDLQKKGTVLQVFCPLPVQYSTFISDFITLFNRSKIC
jgi:hypothetical protein